MALIFWLSQHSSLPSPAGISLSDKTWHALFYTVLGVLLCWAMRPAGVGAVLLAIAIGSAYGYSDEFHQRFVPRRTYDLADWAFDIVGVTAGVLLVALAARLRRRL
jgi:VanZ family protein